LSNVFDIKSNNFDIITKRLEELYKELFPVFEDDSNNKNEDIEIGLQFLKK